MKHDYYFIELTSGYLETLMGDDGWKVCIVAWLFLPLLPCAMLGWCLGDLLYECTKKKGQ